MKPTEAHLQNFANLVQLRDGAPVKRSNDRAAVWADLD